jgi:hypothetical protein
MAFAYRCPTFVTRPADPPNPSLDRCIEVWNRAYKTARLDRKHHVTSTQEAGRAFRAVMPQLEGYENIRDFIACIAQGVILEAITPEESSKLLQAAQVALAALRKDPANKTAKARKTTSAQKTSSFKNAEKSSINGTDSIGYAEISKNQFPENSTKQ